MDDLWTEVQSAPDIRVTSLFYFTLRMGLLLNITTYNVWEKSDSSWDGEHEIQRSEKGGVSSEDTTIKKVIFM